MEHREGEGKHQLKDYLWECVYKCVFLYFCSYILDASLAIVLKKTGRFLPLACSPFPPLLVASWVQADSSSCLFSLIYQARADKCKHLPEYPPHLGGLGCVSFFFNPHMVDQCLSTIFSAWSSSTFTPHRKPFPPASDQVLLWMLV